MSFQPVFSWTIDNVSFQNVALAYPATLPHFPPLCGAENWTLINQPNKKDESRRVGG